MHPANSSTDQNFVIDADPGLDPERFQKQVCEYLNIPDTIPVPKVIELLVGDSIPFTHENLEGINYLLAFIINQQPQSLLEAQLIIQVFRMHQLTTKMLEKAGKENWPEGVEAWVNISTKLARAYRAGLETLGKLRRNGEQRIVIERIFVEKDANAIIGHVSTGGR